MNRLRLRDELVLRDLYDAHGQALIRYASSLTGGDRQRAEDVVQEALLRAWKHPELLRQQGERSASVRAWLCTVVRNLVIDGNRAKAARPPEALRGEIEIEAASDGGLDNALIAMEMTEALDGLAPQHRDVIIEMYFRDRSVAQTAADLGIPEGTVKSRCYYALRALRVLCEERGLTP